MTRDIAADERHIFQVVSSKRFVNMEGLGNELPFFIYAYPATQELDVQDAARRIINRLTTENGLTVLSIDLFALTCDLLRRRGVLEQVVAVEPDEDKADFREMLQDMLDPEQHVAQAIAEMAEAQSHDMVFLTGIGRVFPFMRSHNVLNTMPRQATRKPLLMFFPGDYRQTATQGSALVLFDKLTDDQYYRARNIMDQEA